MDAPLKRSKDYLGENEYSLKKYLQAGHVHGLKYVGSKTKCEKFFWLLIIATSATLTAAFIGKEIYLKADLMTEIKLPPKPIHSLPFPAVTICPETKAQSAVISFTDAYHFFQGDNTNGNYSDEDIQKVEALSQVCDPHLLEDKQLKSPPTPGDELIDILREVSIENHFLLFCKFRGQLEECTKFFKEVVIDDGICYSFNMIHVDEIFKSDNITQSEWRAKTGYKNDDFNAFPFRALSGSDVGFNVVLYQKSSDLDFMCKGPVQGYKVKIHSPDEFPRMSTGYQRIPLNSEVLIKVKPEFSSISESSNCHSSSTKPLKLFKEYSHTNCVSECLANYLFSQCGCVKFSMTYGGNPKICNQHQSQCMNEATHNFSTANRLKEDFACDCKPSCDSLKFHSKVSQATFDFKKVFSAYNEKLDEEFPAAIMSRLVVYIEDEFFFPTKYSTESPFNMIAKLGGILAFFLGASWISFIEIFYFVARRFFC